MLVAIGLSIAIALLRGGSLSRLAQVRFRFPYLILIGFGMQAAIFSPWWPTALVGAPTDLLYVDSIAFLVLAVLANIRLAGLKLLGLGLASNLLVIAANGGAMPISPEALRLAGETRTLETLEAQGRVGHLTPMTLSSPLWPLGDLLFLPKTAVPVPTVFSVGDVVIALGAFWFVQGAMVAVPRPAGDRVARPAARIQRERTRGPAVAPRKPPRGGVGRRDGKSPSWALSARRRLKFLQGRRAPRS